MNKKELERKENHERWLVHYNSLYKALIQNQFEIGKRLLTLSTLAIGLLVGVFGKPDSLCELIALFAANVSFVACIMVVLFTLNMNGKYILDGIKKYHEQNKNKPSRKILEDLDKEIDKKDKLLDICTCASWSLFIVGILLTVIVVLLNVDSAIWKGN